MQAGSQKVVAPLYAAVLAVLLPASAAAAPPSPAEVALTRGLRTLLGLEMGTPVNVAERAVLAAGYQKRDPCFFFAPGAPSFADNIMMSVRPDAPSCGVGDENKPIIRVVYTNQIQGLSAATPEAIVARLNREIGSAPSCKSDQPGQCAWHTPARFPKVKSIELLFGGGQLVIRKENPEWPKLPAKVESAAGKAFDPFAPLAKTDLFSPGGVGIGMPLERVHAGLTAAGFVAPGFGFDNRGCEWTLFRKYEISTRIIISRMAGKGGCKPGAVIREMYFERDDLRPAAIAAAPPGGTAAARFRERAASPTAACTIDQAAAASGKVTQCNVKHPPRSADVGYADMEYRVTPGKSGDVSLRINLRGATEQRVLDGELRPGAR